MQCDVGDGEAGERARLEALDRLPLSKPRRAAWVELARSAHPRVRESALESMGRHPELGDAGRAALTEALSSGAPGVVAVAADVLPNSPRSSVRARGERAQGRPRPGGASSLLAQPRARDRPGRREGASRRSRARLAGGRDRDPHRPRRCGPGGRPAGRQGARPARMPRRQRHRPGSAARGARGGRREGPPVPGAREGRRRRPGSATPCPRGGRAHRPRHRRRDPRHPARPRRGARRGGADPRPCPVGILHGGRRAPDGPGGSSCSSATAAATGTAAPARRCGARPRPWPSPLWTSGSLWRDATPDRARFSSPSRATRTSMEVSLARAGRRRLDSRRRGRRGARRARSR